MNIVKNVVEKMIMLSEDEAETDGFSFKALSIPKKDHSCKSSSCKGMGSCKGKTKDKSKGKGK